MVAGATVATAVGGAIGFVWNKVEKRFNELEEKVAACERREEGGLERRGVQRTVIELLWQEIVRLSPRKNAVLKRAESLLGDLKLLDAERNEE